MVTEGELTLSSEHTIQYTDDVLQNLTPETYILLLTNITPINSIKIKKLISAVSFLKSTTRNFKITFVVCIIFFLESGRCGEENRVMGDILKGV